MNPILIEAIIRHLLGQFGVIPSPHVDSQKSKPLTSKEFLLSEQLSFQDEEGKISKKDVWGCRLSSAQHEVIVVLGDCSQDAIPEYSLVIQPKDAPAYGLHLVCDPVAEPLIAVSVKDNEWMPCSTFLQATFLAGMEQVRETCLTWSPCPEHHPQYELLLSFIKYCSLIYGAQ
jgi:hypothetical protein